MIGLSMAKKLSKKEEKAFKAFKDEFVRWQRKLQCEGYSVYFDCKDLDGVYADIIITESERTASVCVNRKELLSLMPRTAKHEACHLFLGTLHSYAGRRFVDERELDTEWERLSIILEKVL